MIVTLPEVVAMPPPSDDAWFVMIWQEETFSVPWLAMPPPSTAELPLTVQVVKRGRGRAVGVVAVEQAAAAAAAELPLTVQLVSVALPP